MAMVMRGLPEKYKPSMLTVTYGSAEINLGEFKAKLRNFKRAATKKKNWTANRAGVLLLWRKGPPQR